MDEKKKKCSQKNKKSSCMFGENTQSFRQQSNTDPMGSYTGNPTYGDTKPEQDADDL